MGLPTVTLADGGPNLDLIGMSGLPNLIIQSYACKIILYIKSLYSIHSNTRTGSI